MDGSLKAPTCNYGQANEDFFYPLKVVLIFFENLLSSVPWPLVVLALAGIAWFASRSWNIVTAVVLMLLAIGFMGLWVDAMKTVSLVFTSTIFSTAVGIPLGIVMNRYKGAGKVMGAVLDVMRTMPPFVYLIPVVMLLGIGRVPGFIAVVIYAIPPIIRLTDLGIKLVDKEVLEAADAYGCLRNQKLWKAQIPLAMPTIMAGINQTIMMALGMVVIASMIGVQGLGLNVLELRDFRRLHTAMVFQRFGLLPHRTVIDNVTSGLEVRGVGAVDGTPAEIGFKNGGYLFIMPPGSRDMLKQNCDTELSLGCYVVWLEPDALNAKFPSMYVGDLGVAVHSPDDGWLDPHSVLMGFRKKAQSLGAEFIADEVTGMRIASHNSNAPSATLVVLDLGWRGGTSGMRRVMSLRATR